jgi:hypothetical protein
MSRKQTFGVGIRANVLHNSAFRRNLLIAALASFTLLFAVTPHASALTIGLITGDDSWNEEGGWDAIQSSGAKIVRVPFGEADYYNTTKLGEIETMFRRAAERNITILPFLYGRRKEGHEKQFLTQKEWGEENNSWETFVYGVVQKFGYNGGFWTKYPSVPYEPVTAWEVWNEPNLKENNPGTVVQPEEYAKFLKRTSTAIQVAQELRTPGSGTQVLFGGLYSEGPSVGGMSVGEFLKRAHSVSETGLAFNGLSLHPYPFQGGLFGVEQYVNDARNQLNANLWSAKSLWITELGWNVSPWGDELRPYVDESQQRTYLEASFNWIKSVAAAKNIPALFWYMYRDNPVDGKWDHHTGLLRADGTFRPAWEAFLAQTGIAPLPPPPTAWPSESLGGGINADPDIASWGPGRLDVFVRGAADNALWHRAWTGSSWGAWEDLGGSLASGPSAVSWGSGRLDVVARGTDNSVLHWSWDASTDSQWHLDNLGGGINADPDISSWGPGRLDVFVRGASDNALWHKAWTGSSWGAWENLGGGLKSGPGAVSWGANRIDVVARGSGESLWHKAWTGTGWSAWEDLGGGISSDPDISSWGPGRLDVFARGSGNSLWHLPWTGSSWGPWENLGGSIGSGPGAVSWGSNRIDVVTRAYNNSVTHWYWQP